MRPTDSSSTSSKKDKNVFEELLTTEEFYVYHDGDNERMQAASDRIKRIYDYFKDLDWKNFKDEDLLKHAEFLREVKMRSVDPDNLEARNRQGIDAPAVQDVHGHPSPPAWTKDRRRRRPSTSTAATATTS